MIQLYCFTLQKHTTPFRSLGSVRLFNVFIWSKILLEFKNSCFLCKYLLKYNLFLWSKLYFQHHYSSLQCHMIFRNHSNMLICCSRNIFDYYQYWKQLCCTIFLWKLWCILFFRIHRWIESSKEQHLFEIEIFCNIFTVIFNQFNASLMNKSIKI